MSKNFEKFEEEKIGSINPNHDDLTVEKLREFLGNPAMSEEEAKEIIFSISTLGIQ